MIVTVKHEITPDHLVSLFVSIIESNASTYWADGGFNTTDELSEEFTNSDMSWWYNPDFYTSPNMEIYLTYGVEDNDEEDLFEYKTVNSNDIQAGLELASCHFPDAFNEFVANNGFDTWIADTICQCIFLREDIIHNNTEGYFKDKQENGWQLIFG